jgi:phosphatidylserine/phosphatidylglycerophosphate/cardiolipin synthase-like enzyme
MSRSASPRQVIWVAITLIVAAALWYSQRPRPVTPVLQRAPAGAVVDEDHFSPTENLERMDLAQIDGARRSIDVAMFAFTDRYLAEAIVRAAHRGVQVRIYRDHSQFDDEQRKAGQHDNESTTDIFQRERNIQVRVKRSRELMHLKAYCIDGSLLRDGSANWSPSGLKHQDNNARFTTDAREVQEFQHLFEGMWARDNQVVQ